jgi:Uma2 family endonuclease
LFAPVDVRISPTNIVQPDILFISRERQHVFAGDIVEGAPDLVLEILSPSTRQRDETTKLALYASAGVREYWLVDPVARSIRLYTLSETGGYRLIEAVGGLIRSIVLPGFEIDVDAPFEGLD